MLTNYYSDIYLFSFIDKVSNIFLTPIVVALGREVKVEKLNIREVNIEQQLKFEAAKTHYMGTRIVAGLGSIVLAPAACVGIFLRWTSSSYKKLRSSESEYIKKRQSKLAELMLFDQQPKNSLSQLVKLGKKIDEAIKAGIEEETLIPFIISLETNFIRLAFDQRAKSNTFAEINDEFRNNVTSEDILVFHNTLNVFKSHVEQQQLTSTHSIQLQSHCSVLAELHQWKIQQQEAVLKKVIDFSDSIKATTPTDIGQYTIQLAKLANMIRAESDHVDEKTLSSMVTAFEKKLTTLILKKEIETENITLNDLKEEFVNNVVYKDLLSLKRTLSALIQSTQQINTKKLKHYHSVIRTLYYTKFAPEHIAKNLLEKQAIPALNLQLKDIVLEKDPKDAIEQMRMALHDPELAKVTWLHGTKSSTIVAMATSDYLLKPSGELRKEQRLAFVGENNMGCFHVNNTHLSGTSLKSCEGAINYSLGSGVGFNDQVGLKCTEGPAVMIPFFEEKKFNKWLKSDLHGVLQLGSNYTEDSAAPHELYNFHRHMKILWTLEPQLFEQKILPCVTSIIDKLKNYEENEEFENPLYKNAIEKLRKIMFEPILTFKSLLPTYAEDDKNLIRAILPVIVGATGIKLIEEQNHPNTEEKIAILNTKSKMSREYNYQGALKLGEHLKFLFVLQDDMEEMKTYLQIKNIQHVKVYNFETLKMASKFNAFLNNKSQKKIKARKP